MRQIDAGMSLSELTAFTAETWGCSRRNARDVVCAAHKDWLDAAYGSEEIDQKDLLFQQVGRLERIFRRAALCPTPKAVVLHLRSANDGSRSGYRSVLP